MGKGIQAVTLLDRLKREYRIYLVALFIVIIAELIGKRLERLVLPAVIKITD